MKQEKTLFRKMLPSYWGVMLLALLTVTFYAFNAASRLYRQELRRNLEIQAQLIVPQLVAALKAGHPAEIQRICESGGAVSGTRFTVIDPVSGRVLGDSLENPQQMGRHGAERAEINQALKGETGTETRFSQTLQKTMMYVALPVRAADGRMLAVVRAALPTVMIDQTVRQAGAQIMLAGLVTALVALIVCVWMVRRITVPLQNMQRAALHFAAGDLEHKVPAPEIVELARLAQALNGMAGQLRDTLNTVRQQKDELETVLSGLGEGVLAVDGDEQIIKINRAAADLLGTDPESARSRSLQEVVRSAELQEFIIGVLRTGAGAETELRMFGVKERTLEVYASMLRDLKPPSSGVLIVMRDISRIKHLEAVRRDFVANVSHELKTPITSIKGFVETLLESRDDPQEQARFLEIIAKQAERLNHIIDDLLTLSRLERNGLNKDMMLVEAPLAGVINEAVEICGHKAQEKNIRIDIDCGEGLCARVNQPLLEQALVNLIDNAIKYSDAGCTIRIITRLENDQVAIEVADQGCGIEQQHLARLFERFYRVDTARSRKLGGTGLGLAIVKHIVNSHNGTVQVESRPGEGSVFTVRLPAFPFPTAL